MTGLDSTKWKDHTTSRGVNYRYYFSPPSSPAKLTLLFVHGFPSYATDWVNVSRPLEKLGYGIVIPDMFGYGGTDKPVDPAQYRLKLLNQDLVDLLDKEGVNGAIAVGHDWGSITVSRLACHFPERFVAFAHLAVPFVAPDPEADLAKTVALMTSVLGYNPYGYWGFFNEDDAADVIAQHPTVWKDKVCPPGVVRQALLEDYIPPAGTASFISEQEIKEITERFRRDGLGGPLCYYKCEVRGLNRPDDATLPLERRLPPVTTPVFFGVGQSDVICTPTLGRVVFASEPFKQHKITIKEFDGDHWFIISNGEDIARELDAWVAGVVVAGLKA
ncbi:epoxide hydrolase [Cristinia sonorae]|uniref:Epoxide hydrolase n=1 Tax=Cristinia sonorae TaxID=1940300 RepID=A0A8K0UVP5_9AGAR|nr:epoxide hydrolase [Cristinia sonorae]